MTESTRSPAPASTAAAEPEDARELSFSRVYAAPRERVWDAWTDPAQVVRWWGPRGFTTTTHQMDVRPGGTWLFIMHGPDGTDYDNRIVFTELVRPERLVYVHDGGEGSTDPPFHVTVTFADDGGGTRLDMRTVVASAAERARLVEEFGAVEGALQHLERLAEHLAEQ
jgi:uncharacterized protein YndB with AHSA1/START domain